MIVTAINLDQFSAAGPKITWLLNFWRTLFAGDPETGFDHEGTDSLIGQMNIVQFCEFLTRQRRPQVGIALADNIERVLCKVIWQLVIAEISTTAVSDIWRA
ncbi:TPA: hypothetical protein MAC44_001522 [Klebsiella quasipneumoniae subsp. quasipneumoniae]|nr:hypothetical protein [Klebsiella quasipneumoniae subsp. quasipneumoniae]